MAPGEQEVPFVIQKGTSGFSLCSENSEDDKKIVDTKGHTVTSGGLDSLPVPSKIVEERSTLFILDPSVSKRTQKSYPRPVPDLRRGGSRPEKCGTSCLKGYSWVGVESGTS